MEGSVHVHCTQISHFDPRALEHQLVYICFAELRSPLTCTAYYFSHLPTWHQFVTKAAGLTAAFDLEIFELYFLAFLSSLNETYIEFRKQTSHLLPKYSCVLLNQAEVSNLWFADTSSADSRIIRADMRGGLRQHWRLSNSGPVGVERSVGCWSFDRVASFPSKKTDTKLNVEYLLMGLRCSQQMDKQSVQKNQIDQVLLNNSAQCLFQFV